MRLNLLKAEIVKKGVKAKELSMWLSVPKAGIYRRLSGETKLSLEEINTLRIKLQLTNEQIVKIFLEN